MVNKTKMFHVKLMYMGNNEWSYVPSSPYTMEEFVVESASIKAAVRRVLKHFNDSGYTCIYESEYRATFEKVEKVYNEGDVEEYTYEISISYIKKL